MISEFKINFKKKFGGLALVAIIAMSANFLSFHYKAPVMLFALLIGIAFHFLNEEKSCTEGIEFSSSTLLRFGVGLLGLRLTLNDVESIGLIPIIAVLAMVILTLGFGAILSFIFGRRLSFGLLAGGSVAICGASAALAIASVLPQKGDRKQDVILVIIGVTVLSTISMILYPILFSNLGMTERESGYLIGATIHDIAQVVGAGYSVSEEAGLIATFIKMFRISILPLVLIIVMLTFRGAQTQKINLPWFLIMFIALAFLNNLFSVPIFIIYSINEISQWLLILAISALGIKTNLSKIAQVSFNYSSILILETLFLLAISLIFLNFISL